MAEDCHCCFLDGSLFTGSSLVAKSRAATAPGQQPMNGDCYWFLAGSWFSDSCTTTTTGLRRNFFNNERLDCHYSPTTSSSQELATAHDDCGSRHYCQGFHFPHEFDTLGLAAALENFFIAAGSCLRIQYDLLLLNPARLHQSMVSELLDY